MLLHDVRERLLVLEMPGQAEPLARRSAVRPFSSTCARALGRALRLLHSLPSDLIRPPRDVEPHWSLQIHRPRFELLSELSWASMELIRLIQGSTELRDRLTVLREAWEETAIIHGDMRGDNCLATSKPGATRKTRVTVIDWETAGPGDPAFDLAALFADHLDAWVLSMPLGRSHQPARLAQHARLPLACMRPVLRAIWAGYVGTRPAATALRSKLQRALRYTAPRLLQLALERAQRAPDVSRDMVVELQLALNVLRAPDRAAERLLGLR